MVKLLLKNNCNAPVLLPAMAATGAATSSAPPWHTRSCPERVVDFEMLFLTRSHRINFCMGKLRGPHGWSTLQFNKDVWGS